MNQPSITITEALAELKTLNKRIGKKREYVRAYLFRQEGLKDPHEKTGGSPEVIQRETQAIGDLENRIVEIRTAIQKANQSTPITICGTTKTIAEWLTWRKEVAPGVQEHLKMVRLAIHSARSNAQKAGVAVVSASVHNADSKPTDLIVNVDEGGLAKEAENLEEILGTLDGQLSLRNATVQI